MQLIRDSRARASTERVSLLDFFVDITPGWDRPEWFWPYATTLERAVGPQHGAQPTADDPKGGLRIVFAAPPQHGKSELSVRAYLWWDRYFPGRRHAYVTFNETRAEDVAKQFIRIARGAGFEPRGTLDKVELRGGSTVKFTSIKGDLTGSPIDGVCIIDDPIKNAIDARSASVRRDAIEWWKGVARARRHPGTSYVAMATRWHVEDLSGYLIRDEGFRYINLKAIAEPANDADIDQATGRVLSDPLQRLPGESLWPARKPPEFFAEEQSDAYWWAAMYQGEPRPMGGNVFGDAHWYEPHELPDRDYTQAHGIDLAYSAKSHADYSTCWTMRKRGDVYYVVSVLRSQESAPSFAKRLQQQTRIYPGRVRWYGSTTEVGAGQLIGQLGGISVNAMLARGDKFLRAQAFAAAWNAGKIKLPTGGADGAPPWVVPVLDEFGAFTGINDRHDDLIDSGAACFDELSQAGKMPDEQPYVEGSRWDSYGTGRGFG